MERFVSCPICGETPELVHGPCGYFMHCTKGCKSPMCGHAGESGTVLSWNDWARWYELHVDEITWIYGIGGN